SGQDVPVTWGRSVVGIHPGLLRGREHDNGWRGQPGKLVRPSRGEAGSTPAPSAAPDLWRIGSALPLRARDGGSIPSGSTASVKEAFDAVCGVVGSARLAVNQKVAVQIRSDGLHRSVLLGEQAVSKAAAQGSNPCAPASPTWLDAERHRSCKPADTG